MILLLCVYGFIVVIDRTIQYLFLCVSVFVCNLFPFADEMSCCTGANTVFIGTTTTGSSLVHFKLHDSEVRVQVCTVVLQASPEGAGRT